MSAPAPSRPAAAPSCPAAAPSRPAAAPSRPAAQAAPRGLGASLRNVREFKANPLAFYRRLTRDGDSGYREVAFFDLFGPNYLVNGVDEAGRILTGAIDRGGATKDGLRFFEVMGRLLGRGLFTAEGDVHLRQRRLLQPSFQPRAVEDMAGGVVRAASAAGARWSTQVGAALDVEGEMRRLALDLLAELLIGGDLRDDVHEFGALNEEMEARLVEAMGAPVLAPAWLPTPGNRRFAATATRVRAVVARLIAQRRASLEAGRAPDVLLTRLLADELSTGAMGERQFLDEIATLLVGGYKSTALALTWTWYLLATHPDAGRRLAAEVSEQIGQRPPTFADARGLRFTRMVVQESMRLYPPVWVINRVATRRDVLGGVPIPRGAILAVSPYTLHRHPAYWARPDDFHPEHFAEGVTRPAHAYLPFGAGRHKCIGNHHAMAVAILTLATLAARYAFEPPAHPIAASARAFTTPEAGMRMRLTAAATRS
ncbi:cytochrome P450 [Sorangium cellulosum]|uniref:cytochrome P450 n=1 Tax=Sorangium cellulosum TaxID=56 RepID=UPI003D9A479C